jgi:DNA transposition AAA+ family ATPase
MPTAATTQTLDALIARVEKHRAALRLTTTKFAERYQRYLGSVRSYQDRILTRTFDRLNLDKLAKKLAAFVAELDGGTGVETIYADMPALRKLRLLFEVLQGQANDRRCLMFLGVTGVGKTAGARAICNDAETAAATAFVKCLPRWEHSPLAMVNGILVAIGAEAAGSYTAGVGALVENLRATPKTVFFDDAHYGGIALLALLKALIDETPARFVYLAYPTDFKLLISSSVRAHAEAQQLYGRTLKPVFDDYCDGTSERDAACYLRRAAGLDGDAARTAKAVLPLLKRHGNLRLLADAVENVAIECDEAGEEIAGRDIEEEVRKLCRATAQASTLNTQPEAAQ